MCGVFGVSLSPGAPCEQSAEQLARAGLCRLLHRGPDGAGVAGDARSAVGMSRLHVRGTSDDPLPFEDPEGPDVIAYNGEVYVVGLIDGNGSVPRGGVEEAVAAVRQDSPQIDGMYALIRRAEDGSLYLVRDTFGIKPLYIRQEPCGTAAASEISSLTAIWGQPRLRPEAVGQFLLLGRVLDGGTFYEGIEPVRPGERLVIRDGRVAQRIRRQDLTPATSVDIDPEDLREAVRTAVSRVLVADRKLGLAVSGGLDSTIIATELARLGVPDLVTLSVVPAGSGDGVRSLESLHLPGTAWRTWRHHYVDFGPGDLLDGIPGATAVLGEPTSMTSAPMYGALARLARESGVVVLLLGEAADEMFCGYRSYLELGRLHTAAEFYLPAERGDIVRRLIGAEQYKTSRDALIAALPVANGRPPADIVREFEYKHSLEPLLRRADHLLMAEGVEGRTPFLHAGLPAIAASLPLDALLSDAQTKLALRRAYASELPGHLIDVKRPFRAPVDSWFSGAASERLGGELAVYTDQLASVGVDPEAVADLPQQVARGVSGAASTGFALLSLGAWLASSEH